MVVAVAAGLLINSLSAFYLPITSTTQPTGMLRDDYCSVHTSMRVRVLTMCVCVCGGGCCL